MKKRSIEALALGLFIVILLTACAKPQAQEEEAMPAGEDWRTWGWVNDAGTIVNGEDTKQVLVCIFTDEADIYLDDDSQTLYASLPYPDTMEDAREAYLRASFEDLNGDGSSDVRLTFSHADGTQTERVWYWEEANGFVLQTEAP